MSRMVSLFWLAIAIVLPANGQIGTDHAVDLTGRIDGYFKNEAIKILLPDKLQTVEKTLRMAGLGTKIDEFELSMNRAAEKAAPVARDIFKDALMQMTFDDAHRILTGGNTSATQGNEPCIVILATADASTACGRCREIRAAVPAMSRLHSLPSRRASRPGSCWLPARTTFCRLRLRAPI